ncbi:MULTISPECIES: hypothetical protein [Roseateles]|uniref:Uncharacterized protein n=1 Tax=Pelomonas aquatica TaxID=431058 RepID=A0ABU1Z4G7_9BURK|nr:MULTISPECIES: hypothetical protein [Roseateles]KQY81832.1 hypothetical protein ASD35_08595 [Pelomonas sp. Root1444]MDR7295499.1 hypothetical protein [Pelomonas aquatica]
MQTQTNPPTPDTVRQQGANVLRVTLRQLSAWASDDAQHRVILPVADEEAWEGTEIDVRRTVL